eukprot:12869137-Ditylum_brightwellii.AAC.1
MAALSMRWSVVLVVTEFGGDAIDLFLKIKIEIEINIDPRVHNTPSPPCGDSTGIRDKRQSLFSF